MPKASNGNLVLAFENETVNTNDITLGDENATHQKSNRLFRTISLVML